MRLTLAQIAESLTAYGDIDQGGSVEVTGVHTDSRTIRPGDLFICLAGEKFDGHGFAAEAAKAGAVAVVAHTPIEDPGIPVLMRPEVLHNVPLSRRSTIGLGGTALAQVLLRAEEELHAVGEILAELGGRPFVLGAGSNILFDDGELGIVLLTPQFAGTPEMIGQDETHEVPDQRHPRTFRHQAPSQKTHAQAFSHSRNPGQHCQHNARTGETEGAGA